MINSYSGIVSFSIYESNITCELCVLLSAKHIKNRHDVIDLVFLCSHPQSGFRFHYVDIGSGPPVILCHGFPESWYEWKRQVNFQMSSIFSSFSSVWSLFTYFFVNSILCYFVGKILITYVIIQFSMTLYVIYIFVYFLKNYVCMCDVIFNVLLIS